jgi:hypothetical protein
LLNGIKRLHGAAAVFVFAQVVVEHVFDQGHLVVRQHLRQALALGHRHAGAHGVGQRGHGQHGFDGLGVQRQLQRVQRQAGARVRGDLQRAQAQVLQDLQEAVIGG